MQNAEMGEGLYIRFPVFAFCVMNGLWNPARRGNSEKCGFHLQFIIFHSLALLILEMNNEK